MTFRSHYVSLRELSAMTSRALKSGSIGERAKLKERLPAIRAFHQKERPPLSEIAREHGTTPETIRKWIHELYNHDREE